MASSKGDDGLAEGDDCAIAVGVSVDGDGHVAFGFVLDIAEDFLAALVGRRQFHHGDYFFVVEVVESEEIYFGASLLAALGIGRAVEILAALVVFFQPASERSTFPFSTLR